MKRANLRDVARMSGVSIATVSRVLNSPAVVSESTRARVQSAIDELAFFPNPSARAVSIGRTKVVGALIPTLDNAIFARFLNGLEGRLATRGFSLVVSSTGEYPETEATKAQSLVNIGAEGLIVSGITHCKNFEALTSRTRIPVVMTSYYDASSRIPTVGYDNRLAAQLALRHLVGLGHSRIAVIHGPKGNNDRTRARIEGLADLRTPTELQFHETDVSIGGGCSAVREILAEEQTFTAFLCFSDVLATGALYELRRAGIQVPMEVSVVGMEDLPSSSWIEPRLTTVRLPVLEMGHSAADALASWIETREVPESVQLPAELVVRQSTAQRA